MHKHPAHLVFPVNLLEPHHLPGRYSVVCLSQLSTSQNSGTSGTSVSSQLPPSSVPSGLNSGINPAPHVVNPVLAFLKAFRLRSDKESLKTRTCERFSSSSVSEAKKLLWDCCAHRTSSNLLEPHLHRDSKVWRVLSHVFGVVRLYRTFSIYIVTRETRCAGCLCTSSGWFKHIEPPRTFSNHIITEIARCGEFCPMRSGWFDCTEPSLSTLLQGKQGVQGAYALVRGGSSTSNLLEPSRTTSQVW